MQNIGKERINWIHDIHIYQVQHSHVQAVWSSKNTSNTKSNGNKDPVNHQLPSLIDFKIKLPVGFKKTTHISRNRFHLKQTLSCWAPPHKCGTYFRPNQVNKLRSFRTSGPSHNTSCISPFRSLPAWLNDSDTTFLWELNKIYVTLIRYETSSPFFQRHVIKIH